MLVWPWPSKCLLIEAVNETDRIYNRSQHICGWNLELTLLVGISLPPCWSSIEIWNSILNSRIAQDLIISTAVTHNLE